VFRLRARERQSREKRKPAETRRKDVSRFCLENEEEETLRAVKGKNNRLMRGEKKSTVGDALFCALCEELYRFKSNTTKYLQWEKTLHVLRGNQETPKDPSNLKNPGPPMREATWHVERKRNVFCRGREGRGKKEARGIPDVESRKIR